MPGRDDKSVSAVFVGLVMRRTLPNEKRSYLLIDVSNSFTKFAFATKQRLTATERVETARLSGASIGRLLRKRRVDHVVVSSVVPKKNALIRQSAKGIRTLFVSACPGATSVLGARKRTAISW